VSRSLREIVNVKKKSSLKLDALINYVSRSLRQISPISFNQVNSDCKKKSNFNKFKSTAIFLNLCNLVNEILYLETEVVKL